MRAAYYEKNGSARDVLKLAASGHNTDLDDAALEDMVDDIWAFTAPNAADRTVRMAERTQFWLAQLAGGSEQGGTES